jgi:hypothetical protein
MNPRNPIFWVEVIAYIVELIITGRPEESAVSAASMKFGVSEIEIWGHSGF